MKFQVLVLCVLVCFFFSKFVKVTPGSLKGLIQLRNELVHHLDKNLLPEVKNEPRFCAKCPQLVACSLFNDAEEAAIEAVTGERSSNNIDTYASSIAHLSDAHKTYFFKWYRMLELEFSDYKQFNAGPMIWWESSKKLESAGWTVFDLKLKQAASTSISSASAEYAGEGFFPFEFEKEDG